MRKIILLIILFVIPTLQIIARVNDSTELTGIKQRINLLESNRENFDDKFENKSVALDNEFTKLKNELDSNYSYIKLFVWIFGTATIIGFLIVVFRIFKYVDKTAKEKVSKKFDSLFDSNKDRLIQLIEQKSEEHLLKENSTIVVITSSESTDAFVKRFFQLSEFQKVSYFKTKDFLDLQPPFEGIVFINNEDGKLDGNHIRDFISTCSAKTLFFYFGSQLTSIDRNFDRIGYANNKVQIYGNLMNILKYKHFFN